MILPKGAIWQEIRGAALDAIPPRVRIDWARPVTLSDWQTNGYYTVSTVTSKSFVIVTSSQDFGSALLGDAEWFLDHAAEHQVTLWRQIQAASWLSPAWLAVTAYYWAFFLALALSRLMGMGAWHLTPRNATNLTRLAPTPTKRPPGSGSFRVSVGSIVSSNDREVELRKRGGRVHDDVWTMLWEVCDEKLRLVGPSSGNQLEERLFTAIVEAGRSLGASWPSSLRNSINYLPGFAYTAVRRTRVLSSFGYLQSPTTYTAEELVNRLENSVAALAAVTSITDDPQAAVELLMYFTFTLHALTHELYGELIDRHSLDSRWRTSRSRFLRENGIHAASAWPVAS